MKTFYLFIIRIIDSTGSSHLKPVKSILFLLLLFLPQYISSQTLFLEAENFSDKGGWMVDHQSYDQIGSFYLLAHGNGVPVKNASTNFVISKSGEYHVYVLTRNWMATWYEDNKYAPGVFQVALNDKKLNNSSGNSGKNWDWQYCGSMNLAKGSNKIELIDQTGFGARCDAVLITTDRDNDIIKNKEILKKTREQTYITNTEKKEYELIVVGGGIAGLSAAITSSRHGLKTCLINNRPVLGGNNSTEMRIIVSGDLMKPPYEKLGRVVNEIKNIYENPERINSIVKKEPNLDVFLNTQVVDVIMDKNKIKSVVCKNLENYTRTIISGSYFADCTGDANLGYYAGADYMVGREPRSRFNELLAPESESKLSYGSTLKWKATEEKQKISFPSLTWAIQFTNLTAIKQTESTWNWETGYRYDQIADAEFIRDYMLRVIYGNWSYLKNSDSTKNSYEKWNLNFVSPILGKRESRRLVGDVIFTQNDIEGEWKKYDDAFIIGTYSIDQHLPLPENTMFFPGEEFQAAFKHNEYPIGFDLEYKYPELKNPPYYIPYRCLYSKNIENLFMAGRDISCSRVAFCSTRVQGPCGLAGEVVGIAASVCVEKKCTPRSVYTQYLELLKNKLHSINY